MSQADGYRTAVQFAYEQLKAWVLDQTLPPDARIDQDELARRLNLSRTPVRTALEKLSSEGLVQTVPHRGARISPLRKSDLAEVYMLRELLETQAIRLAVERATLEDLDQIELLMNSSEELIGSERFPEYLNVNRAFHLRIYESARSPVLLRLISMLWDMSLRYRAVFLQLPGGVEDSIAEHREMVRLLRERNESGLIAYLTRHNYNTRDRLLERFGDDLPDVTLVAVPVSTT